MGGGRKSITCVTLYRRPQSECSQDGSHVNVSLLVCDKPMLTCV